MSVICLRDDGRLLNVEGTVTEKAHFPNFVLVSEKSNAPHVEDRSVARTGRTETGI